MNLEKKESINIILCFNGKPRKVEIIPSILPADWANMGGECKRLEDAGVDRIQFDVMDGNFVPNLTFGPELIAACRKYVTVLFETQLMFPSTTAKLCSISTLRPRRVPMENPVL